jgi:hypothetical protein
MLPPAYESSEESLEVAGKHQNSAWNTLGAQERGTVLTGSVARIVFTLETLVLRLESLV